MNKENKLYPFCENVDLYESIPFSFYINCCNCSAEEPIEDTLEEAWEKWNKRSSKDDRN